MSELKRYDEYNEENCPTCKDNKWHGIPDSLAEVCESCGFVRVLGGRKGGRYTVGATLQEWAKDLYDASQENKNPLPPLEFDE